MKKKQKKLKIGDPKIKKKKYKISTLRNKLWELIKQYIRKKHGNVCYTCGQENLIGRNCHTGHYIPSVLCPFELRYEERNLRPQCYNCNINLGGNGGRFGEKLKGDFGQGYVDDLWTMQRQPKIKKANAFDYLALMEEYKKKLKDLDKP